MNDQQSRVEAPTFSLLYATPTLPGVTDLDVIASRWIGCIADDGTPNRVAYIDRHLQRVVAVHEYHLNLENPDADFAEMCAVAQASNPGATVTPDLTRMCATISYPPSNERPADAAA